ncbi:hypothetical protein RHGRI_023976 [Rhododendron griersonianum]|uniref:Uncharacterized protein n=1 Tax=Rhododendron griersonianum TaxID=479676 RepID=A0AAV6JB17_9ERIC|nr:hypothetical protein RHGRI_023976 [Rhododendron griersonianum]
MSVDAQKSVDRFSLDEIKIGRLNNLPRSPPELWPHTSRFSPDLMCIEVVPLLWLVEAGIVADAPISGEEECISPTTTTEQLRLSSGVGLTEIGFFVDGYRNPGVVKTQVLMCSLITGSENPFGRLQIRASVDQNSEIRIGFPLREFEKNCFIKLPRETTSFSIREEQIKEWGQIVFSPAAVALLGTLEFSEVDEMLLLLLLAELEMKGGGAS